MTDTVGNGRVNPTKVTKPMSGFKVRPQLEQHEKCVVVQLALTPSEQFFSIAGRV